jgi:hypothetical protein
MNSILTIIGIILSLMGFNYPNNTPPVQYEHVFYEGEKYKIVVLQDMQIAYVNLKGNVIHYAYRFDNGPDYFVEGLSRYVENGKVGFINQNLDVVIPAQFDWTSYFENGIAKICNGCKEIPDGEHFRMEGGLWGTIDKNGSVTWNNE